MKTLAVLFTLSSATLVEAGVEAVSLILREDSTTFAEFYTVPAGKVFILEAVRNQFQSGAVQARISYGNTHPSPAGNFGWTFDVRDGVTSGLVFLERPLKLPAGSSLRATETGVTVSYFGMLVDAGDLYAANIDVKLKNPTVSGGMLTAEAHLSSPRPHTLSVKKSESLASFSPDPEVEITPTSDPSVKLIKTPATGPTKFITASATSR